MPILDAKARTMLRKPSLKRVLLLASRSHEIDTAFHALKTEIPASVLSSRQRLEKGKYVLEMGVVDLPSERPPLKPDADGRKPASTGT
jgi:hypothetical protein